MLSFAFVEILDNSMPARAIEVDYRTFSIMTVAPHVLIGDINYDGRISISDSIYLRMFIAGERIPTDDQFIVADISGDKLLNAIDFAMLNNMVMGGSGSIPYLVVLESYTKAERDIIRGGGFGATASA